MLSKYKLNQLYFKDTQFANLMTGGFSTCC